ncbi:MAG: histidine phosphatase family protein [Acidimicrobiales bacterium]
MPPRRASGPAVAFLVRHGHTPTTGEVLPGRARGLHLSDQGRAQADAVAERIAALRRPPVAVYSSPQERAMETAKSIASRLGLRVKVERALAECDCGSWTGAKLREVRRRREWRTVQQLPSAFKFPDGESFAQMQARAMEAVDRLSESHRGQSFVAVSHADPIKAVIATTAGVPLDLFQRLVVSPCSVTVVLRGATGYRVLCMNSTATLAELALS